MTLKLPLNKKLKFDLLYLSLIMLIIIYRIFILIEYNVRFVDDDQALMWNGAAAFSHLTMPEPGFWGQSYGSMFEAFIATPLLWLKIPFNYALPIAVLEVSLFPFLFISVILKRKGFRLEAFMVFAIYICQGWKWDILSQVPRNLISGLPFAFLSIYFMSEQSSVKVGIGTFLACIGVIMTPTTIFLSAFGFIYWFFVSIQKVHEAPDTDAPTSRRYTLYQRCLCTLGSERLRFFYHKNGRSFFYMLISFVCCALIYCFKTNFYRVNSVFSLHPAYQVRFSLSVLKENLADIFNIMKDFIFIDSGEIVLMIFIMALIGLLQYKRSWLTAVMIASLITMCIGLFSMDKTLDFISNGVLFSRTRMFLCISCSAVSILYFNSFLPSWGGRISDRFSYPVQRAHIIILVLCVISVLYKTQVIISNINDPQSELYEPGVVRLYKVDELKNASEEIINIAEQNDIDVVIIRNDRRGLAYALDAFYYRKYIFYNITYDRRTWNYLLLSQVTPYKCLFVDYHNGDPVTYDIVRIEDDSVVNYIKNHYSIYRNPYLKQ